METRILVIEDDLPILDTMVRLLEIEGFSAYGASGGQEGLVLIAQHQPNVIVCDVMMPGISGFDVLKAVRANPQAADTPFIFLTAKSQRGDMRHAMELGANDYITKPFEIHELIKAVHIQLRTLDMIQELARARERERLSRDLHDAVSQTLWSAGLLADSLPALWESDMEKARRRHSQMQALIHGAYAELRTLMLEFRPGVLTQLGLRAALAQMAASVSSYSGLSIDLTEQPLPELDGETILQLYRIVQEALNNVIKHAAASHVVIDPRCQGPEFLLDVRDDGLGFNPEQESSGGMGFDNMRTRAGSIGGMLNISSEPGQGTLVRVSIPGRCEVLKS